MSCEYKHRSGDTGSHSEDLLLLSAGSYTHLHPLNSAQCSPVSHPYRHWYFLLCRKTSTLWSSQQISWMKLFFQVWIWWNFCSDWLGSVPSLAQLVISRLILQSQPVWWWSHRMKACSFWVTEWNNFRILLAVLIFQKSYTAWVEWWWKYIHF